MNFLKSFKSALTSVKSWLMDSTDQNIKVLGRTWQSMRMVDKLECPQSQLQGAPILGQLATIICPPILHQSKRSLDAHDNTAWLNQPLVQNCGVASGKQLQGAPMLSHSPILYSFSIKVEVHLCVWRREGSSTTTLRCIGPFYFHVEMTYMLVWCVLYHDKLLTLSEYGVGRRVAAAWQPKVANTWTSKKNGGNFHPLCEHC